MNQFVNSHITLLILIALIPITVLRMTFNLLVYNKIYQSNYIPFLHGYQKGGVTAGNVSAIIFWWIKKEKDTPEIKKYKLIANVLSVFSLLCAGFVIILFIMFGD